MGALQIAMAVATALPTLIKVIGIVTEAAKRYKEAEDKRAWAEDELAKLKPTLSGDQVYDWIKAGLYFARLFGVKI